MIFWRVSGAGKSSRGSRPGFVRASKISITVKTQAYNLVAKLSINTKLILAMLLWRLLTYYFGMFAGIIALIVKPNRVQHRK